MVMRAHRVVLLHVATLASLGLTSEARPAPDVPAPPRLPAGFGSLGRHPLARHGVVNPLEPATSQHDQPLPTAFTGSARVLKANKELLLEGNGLANKFLGVDMPADALFRIGSNSKLFVTVALYQLQERGVLSISDPVSKHLDAADFAAFGWPNVTEWCPRLSPASPCQSPTIEQLLSMGSGLIDVTNCNYPAGSPFLNYW